MCALNFARLKDHDRKDAREELILLFLDEQFFKNIEFTYN